MINANLPTCFKHVSPFFLLVTWFPKSQRQSQLMGWPLALELLMKISTDGAQVLVDGGRYLDVPLEVSKWLVQ